MSNQGSDSIVWVKARAALRALAEELGITAAVIGLTGLKRTNSTLCTNAVTLWCSRVCMSRAGSGSLEALSAVLVMCLDIATDMPSIVSVMRIPVEGRSEEQVVEDMVDPDDWAHDPSCRGAARLS